MSRGRERTPRTVLTLDEEARIIEVIKRVSERGLPASRDNVADSVQVLIEYLPDDRRKCISFTDGRLGKNFR